MKKEKRFLTYEEQIELLKNKKLTFINENQAIDYLQKFSYYSLISGYKDIFKIERNGNYRPDAHFEDIVCLYLLDDFLRNLFLNQLISIEKHIKSLYSYYFCEMYGDKQRNYLNVTNYNYGKYQEQINDFVSITKNVISHSEKYPYINYNIKKYETVPLWVIIHTLTFGNISKLYSFSEESLQSKVAKNFKSVYNTHLSSMLNVLSKFRNVCAHGERLYNFKTKNGIMDLPIHKQITGAYNIGKNDLFNVCICFKYLLTRNDFDRFFSSLSEIIDITSQQLGDYYNQQILNEMGFPKEWKSLLKE